MEELKSIKNILVFEIETMDNYEWKRNYISRLIKHGLTRKEALNNYKAIVGGIDYAIDPESAADDEISYMKGN